MLLPDHTLIQIPLAQRQNQGGFAPVHLVLEPAFEVCLAARGEDAAGGERAVAGECADAEARGEGGGGEAWGRGGLVGGIEGGGGGAGGTYRRR